MRNKKRIIDVPWVIRFVKTLNLDKIVRGLTKSEKITRGQLKHVISFGEQWGYDNKSLINMIERNIIPNLTNEFIAKLQSKSQNNTNEPTTIILNNIIYEKRDTSAYKKFKEAANIVDELLNSLKAVGSFHKECLLRNNKFKVVFTSSIKSRALFDYEKDEIRINLRKERNINDDRYGHLKYVIVHEMGHRWSYITKFNDFRTPIYTTQYSQTDTMTNDEWVAELFALSYFNKLNNSYNEYEKEIHSFLRRIEIGY